MCQPLIKCRNKKDGSYGRKSVKSKLSLKLFKQMRFDATEETRQTDSLLPLPSSPSQLSGLYMGTEFLITVSIQCVSSGSDERTVTKFRRGRS